MVGNYPSLSDIDLEKSKNSEDLIRKTADQVIKDFAQFGFDITFSGNIRYVYDELFEQLAEHILALMETNLEKLYNLLYRIDLNENAIANIATANPDKPLFEIITGMILDRELKKVLTREFFKQNR